LFVNERICIACRKRSNKEKLIRLTVEPVSGVVFLNQEGKHKQKINGRSAYFCRSLTCFETATKGTYLKHALTGRQAKTGKARRPISWPLQSQLIKDIVALCTEPGKTCQNTRDTEV
jgi:predicted RNA-binding protein YlxR (DUF448 family)